MSFDDMRKNGIPHDMWDNALLDAWLCEEEEEEEEEED